MDIGSQCGVNLLFLHQGVYSHQSPHQFIIAMNLSLCLAVIHCCIGSQMVQIPMAVTQMMYLCLGLHGGSRREDVRSQSLGSDVGTDGIERVARHKVVQVQLVNLCCQVVTHHVSIDHTLGLSGSEPGQRYIKQIGVSHVTGKHKGILVFILPVLSPADKVIIHPFCQLTAPVQSYDPQGSNGNGLKTAFVVCMGHLTYLRLFSPYILTGKSEYVVISQQSRKRSVRVSFLQLRQGIVGGDDGGKRPEISFVQYAEELG